MNGAMTMPAASGLAVLVFVSVSCALAGAWSLLSDLWLRDQARVRRRLEEEFKQKQRERLRRSSLFKNLGQMQKELASPRVPRLAWRARLERLVQQSGLDLTVPQLGWWLTGSAGGLALVLGLWRQSLPAAALGALGGASLPLLWLYRCCQARRFKLLAQLPEVLDLMARTLRAGQTMSQAMQTLAEQVRAPAGVEFAYCYEQQHLGLSVEQSLRELAQRNDLLELKVLVLSLLVHQQTGGNLAELLDKLAGVVRDRFRLRTRVRTLTAEGRLQPVILMALPPLMLVGLWFSHPSYVRVLFDYPWMLLTAGVWQLLGGLWIWRIGKIDS